MAEREVEMYNKIANFVLILLGVAIIVASHYVPLELRLSFIAFCLLPLIFIVLAIGLVIKFSTGTEKRSIISQVPINHKLVLRNVWWSNPKTLVGYQEKSEGWRLYVRTIWHSDEGLVNLKPVQFDTKPFTVNCIDGNDVEIDARVTYFIREDDNAAIKCKINTSDNDRDNLVVQRVKVALNGAMNVGSKKVIEWSAHKKKQYGNNVTNRANELLRNDGGTVVSEATVKNIEVLNDDGSIKTRTIYNDDAKITKDGKDYGLKAIVEIENVVPTPAVKAAADRKKAAEIDREASEDEAAGLSTIIKGTGANATWVMVAEKVGDAIAAAFGKGR